MPLLLPLIATAIVLSSFILAETRTLTLAQGLSALVIGGVLGGAAFLLLKSIAGVDLKKSFGEIMMLPLLLPMIALSIVLSGAILTMMPTISVKQGISAIFVGASMGAAAFLLLKAVKGINLGEAGFMQGVMMLPLLLPIIALSIVLSSVVLQLFMPIRNPKEVLVGAGIISLTTLAFLPTLFLISKFKINEKDILKAGLTIILLSTALVVSSYIFALGMYDKAPPLRWTKKCRCIITTFWFSYSWFKFSY